MKTIHLVALASLALLTAACGADSRSLASETAELDGEVADVEQALVEHGSAITEAADMAAIVIEEDTFMNDTMLPHFQRMETLMQRMAKCEDGSGNHPSMGGMQGEVSGMRTDCEEHHDRMIGAADLGAAHGEEAHHQSVMHHHLTAMGDGAHGMIGAGMDGNQMSCAAD